MTTDFAGPMPHGKDSRLRVRDAVHFNAGPPPALQGGEAITPTGLFFTRSHGHVPAVDRSGWRLGVRGLVNQEMDLSLADLQRTFTPRTVAATLVCAGLRRDELSTVRPVPGELPWGLEPVGTGRFTGVALREVLHAAGISDTTAHVAFTGLDSVQRKERRFGFGGSIPLAKALSPEVLLVFEMNGEPLPAVHGGPLRVVVPGYVGARSVKWLGEIELRSTPSENYFQREAYRLQRTIGDGDTRDVSAGEPLGELPLNSVILTPESRSPLLAGPTEVAGWACGGEHRRPARVEVSGDDGVTWREATLDSAAGPWAWVLWRGTVMLEPGPRTLIARAWDRDGAGQPETLAEVWNVKGYANNAWHRVPVEVRRSPDAVARARGGR